MRSTILAAMFLIVGISNAEATRRHTRTVDHTPPASPVCLSGNIEIDCITGAILPVHEDAEEVESTSLPTRTGTYNTIVVGVTDEDEITVIPPDLPLDLNRYTIEEFNDSRVATLHNRVGALITSAVRNARQPRSAERNQSLIDEIQVRLDLLADTSSRERVIDRYWINAYADRTIVYVKPLRNLHIITYTILTQ